MATWKQQAQTPCGLPLRVSKPKHRRSWSLERLAKLMSSPLYQGSTRQQRARRPKGKERFVTRDALYWVPLIMISMGARPEEILQLPLGNVILRNHVYAITIEDALKGPQSRRILPIPQLLLDLGFVEWVRSKIKEGKTWMFPEIDEDQSHNKKSQTFGKKLRNILETLEIRCDEEDIYAMRRTLSSKLLHAGVDTGVRQRILGHLEGTTVDAHYSDDDLAAEFIADPRLALRDAVDLRLVQGVDLAAALRSLVQETADQPELVENPVAQGPVGDFVEVAAQVAHDAARVTLELSQGLAHAAELAGMGIAAHLHGQPGREPIVALPQLDPGLCRQGNQLAARLLVEPGVRRMGDHSGGLRGCTAATVPLHIIQHGGVDRDPGQAPLIDRAGFPPGLDRLGQQPLHPVLADLLAPAHQR